MADILENPVDLIDDTYEHPVDLIDDAYEQEIQVEQEPIEFVSYRSYNQLDDKPQINGVEIVGNKTSSDLGITAQINSAVNSEAQTRQQADSTLQGKIDAEETARKAADKDIQDVLDGETQARQNADTALGGRIDTEIHDRQTADIGLQGQIDAITSKSDVVDVVATYAALQAYDTQHLGDNDVIKVLDDDTHGDALTYYRWSKTNQTWSYIGQEAPYYSKSQTDTLLLGKQNKIDSANKLSADLVDDTNATNKFVTAEDKTKWNAKQDKLTAGTGIHIEDGVISTPAIVPEIVAELPATGEEGKLYLTSKAHTTQTATGNPITATVTEDDGQMESFQLDGDTFQHSYTGKNMIGFPTGNFSQEGLTFNFAADGTITIDGTKDNTGVSYFNGGSLFNFIEGSFTFTLIPISGSFSGANIGYRAHKTGIPQQAWYQAVNSGGVYNQPTLTKTTEQIEEVAGIQLLIGSGSAVFDNFKFKIQVTAGGDHDTSYEPYVGGTPSPNLNYPQAIETVTGTQTITINGTDYPLDLGNIELNNLGDTYIDRIFKDGNDWKIHKATNTKVYDGTNQGFYSRLSTDVNGKFRFQLDGSEEERSIAQSSSDAYFVGLCNELRAGSRDETYHAQNTDGDIIAPRTASSYGNMGVVYAEAISMMTVTEANAWLATNNMVVTYALETPTDTTITDQTLIAQLEAIRTASLQNGANTITNSATGSNLAGDMKIGYYGYNPRNRYDEWLWLDINNEYEQIGS